MSKEKKREYDKARLASKRDELNAQSRRYYYANKEKCLENQREYYKNNKETKDQKNKEYYKNNKEFVSERHSDYRKNNVSKIRAFSAKRRASNLQATPKWLTKDHHKEIESLYSLAKELQWLSESRLEIDHIVPLQGKNVCGLHVPWNLQILNCHSNRSKSNKEV